MAVRCPKRSFLVSFTHLQLTYDLRKAEIERGEAIKAQVQRIAHCA